MIAFLICIITIFILQMLTPFWWWIMVVPFGYFLLKGESAKLSFLKGMLSAGCVWIFSSLYFYTSGSQIIASRMAVMMQLPHAYLVILITTLIAAIAGGVAGLSGFFIRNVFIAKE